MLTVQFFDLGSEIASGTADTVNGLMPMLNPVIYFLFGAFFLIILMILIIKLFR